MSQNDMVIANAPGATVRADINAALAALVGQNSGATAPSTTYPFMWWFDTANSLLKIRNSADSAWVTVASLSGTTWKPYLNGSAMDTTFAALAAANAFTASQEVTHGSSPYWRATDTSGPSGELVATAALVALGSRTAHDVSLKANNVEIAKLISGGGITVGSPTGGDQGAGSINAEGLYVNGAAVGGGMARGGSLDLSSGTGGTITDLGGITDPDIIALSFTDLSFDGTDDGLVQIGDSGGIETADYNSVTTAAGLGTGGVENSASGFVLKAGNAGRKVHADMILRRNVDTNVWVSAHAGGMTDATPGGIVGGGSKTLSGTLDRVAFGATGSNNCDGGKVQLWAGKVA